MAKRVNTSHNCCWDKFIMIRTSSETQGQLVGTIESSRLQYSSQIVETDTVSLEFSGKFFTVLIFTPHTFVLTEMCPLPPQCWATRILKHWDHCNTQINIGEVKCFKIFDEDCSGPWVSEDALRTKRPKLLPNFVYRFSLLVGKNPGNQVDSYPHREALAKSNLFP